MTTITLTDAEKTMLRDALLAYSSQTAQKLPSFDLMLENEQARKLGGALVRLAHDINKLDNKIRCA